MPKPSPIDQIDQSSFIPCIRAVFRTPGVFEPGTSIYQSTFSMGKDHEILWDREHSVVWIYKLGGVGPNRKRVAGPFIAGVGDGSGIEPMPPTEPIPEASEKAKVVR